MGCRIPKKMQFKKETSNNPMKMKSTISILILLSSFTTVAQNDPQKIIDEFFTLYKNKSADAALDYIFGTNKWMENSKDQIDGVKLKLNSSLKLLGEYYGHNLITKKSIGDHLSLYTFMVRYDRQALRFSILMYKANENWKMMNFSYDDNLDDELEEAAKAYRLKENAN
jgi:hypothetical protein